MRVAAWQCRPGPLEVAGNLARLDGVAQEAAAQGADLLVVPELFTTGYAIGATATRELGEPFDGPTPTAIGGIAAEHRIAIAWGFAERDAEVYNAAGVLGADGGFLAHHRKIHLWGETDREQFSAADERPRAFGFGDTTAGLLICYDVEFPEPVRDLAAQGARLIIVPTANPVGCEDVQHVLLRARALENGVALIYANYCGSDDQFTYNGTSMIIGPDGVVLAEASRDDEVLLVAEVPLADPAHGAYLRDRRADLYADDGGTASTTSNSTA